MPGAAVNLVQRCHSAAVGLAAWVALAAVAAPSLPPLVDEPSLSIGEGWRVVGLPGQKPPLTRFSAERIDGRAAVRVQTQASYGNLVHSLPAPTSSRRLSWAWRVDVPNPQSDLSTRSGDDSAVRVCMSFDLPLDRISLAERLRLTTARQLTGEKLPAATLCWVWDPRETPGRVIENVYSRRVRYLVVRGAGDAIGRWAEDSRDLAADFARVFGDESAVLPSVSAVIVGGDADNSGGMSLAFVAALRLEP